MVRFRVIKGSRLLLGIAVVALALVLCLMALRFALRGSEADAALTKGNLVQGAEEEAETASAVFASSVKAAIPQGIEIEILKPDPGGQASEDALSAGENEHTDDSVAPIDLDPSGPPAETPEPIASPRVLIYHTHTHEAYEQAENDPYVAVEAWRTTDEAHSIVRVGAELAEHLRALGVEVVHDATDHEQNDLSTAYLRSEETLTSYKEPFDLYIDLHRDAYVEGVNPVAVSSSGTEYAKLMLLIGKGDNFEEKPHFSENYAFARALTERLNGIEPGICRDVLAKTKRYNQHIGVYAVLIEVGNNKNTLEQALNSMPVLAIAIESVLTDTSGDAR
jgi:stage II sporulation protein P